MASIVELRDKSDDQIEDMLENAREEMFNLRFQLASAQLDDMSRVRQVRRDMAQFQTVLHQRELAVEAALQIEEVAGALEDVDWTAEARFSYEDSAWLVEFADENDDKITETSVNLNQKQPKGRRDRRSKKA